MLLSTALQHPQMVKRLADGFKVSLPMEELNMSRDYPTLDEQYGPGAEQADAEAQDDVVTELQEAIDSRTGYNHRYWTEVATRAVEKLQRLETALRRYGGHAFMQCDATKIKTNGLGVIIKERDPCTCGWDEAKKLLTQASGEAKS